MGRDAKRNHAAHPNRAPKPGGTDEHAIEAANLRELARNIVCLEHFEQIVATAHPSMRAHVRKLLAVYVPFHVPPVVPLTLSHFADSAENTPEQEARRLAHIESTLDPPRIQPARTGRLSILRFDDNGE